MKQQQQQSIHRGYPNGAAFRVHNGNYSEQADMEDPSLPLYARQKEVPLLPVPELEKTIPMFLKSVRPLVTAEEFKKTTAAAEELMKSSFGKELQRRLLQRAKEMGSRKNRTSWFIDWWNQWAYLQYRDSVVHNVTYELYFRDECMAAMSNPARRAARFTYHALKYRAMVVNGTLKPDEDAKTGLAWENSQHKYVFNCCRMPEIPSDTSRTYAPDLHPHICVAHKNRFYTFNVLKNAKTGEPLPVDTIQAQFQKILDSAKNLSREEYPIGILTADDRDTWTKTRETLTGGKVGAETNKVNTASLEAIQSSVFMVCFDDELVNGDEANVGGAGLVFSVYSNFHRWGLTIAINDNISSSNEAARFPPVSRRDGVRAFLHGSTAENRFWDKSFQIAVATNGKMAYVGEHSMTDGMTTTRFVNYVLDKMFAEPESSRAVDTASSSSSKSRGGSSSSASAPAEKTPELLTFELSSATIADIKRAKATFREMTAQKDFDVLMFHGFGADEIKKWGVSPDAFAQMAIQLANRLAFNKPKATYESTQTRTFLHGRTEVTRSLSVESEAFCDAVVRSAPKEEIYAKLEEACKAHSKYIALASKGLGVDRHLLGLKFLIQPGEATPALFSDPGYTRSNHWAISTSGLVGELMDGWAFGEVVPDGLGIGYSVQKHRLRFTVSSRHRKERWAARMVARLEDALIIMKEACVAGKKDGTGNKEAGGAPKAKL